MRDEPRDRAIRAALALLHQPGAAGASGAWRTVGELGRIGVQLRSAVDEATTAFETLGTLATLGARPGGAEPWTAAAMQLADRLEEAAAWWTVGSDFSWPAWDEPSSAALGELLCELDALAAALLTAAGTDAPPPPSPLFPADAEPTAQAPGAAGGAGMAEVIELDAHRRSARRRGHGYHGRLVPSIGLAAAAVVGVLGGITVAASRVSPAEVPRRAIVSEPVPYTLHDADPTAVAGGGAGGTAGPVPAEGAAGSAGAAQAGASGKPSSPASAPSAGTAASAAPVSAPGVPASPGPASAPQGSKTPQPRDAGAPPSLPATLPAQQLGGVVTGIRTQAEQVQLQQLRELAERMQAAMGLTTGFRTP